MTAEAGGETGRDKGPDYRDTSNLLEREEKPEGGSLVQCSGGRLEGDLVAPPSRLVTAIPHHAKLLFHSV